MTQMRDGNGDPAIKLFGATISLPPCRSEDLSYKEVVTAESNNKDKKCPNSEDDANPSSTVCTDDQDRELAKGNKADEEQQIESSYLEENTAKKPEKILPCPRCKSMDTKFCYYNNYKLNQPRHFCKKCQRYWTAGGTMRNVPVGAGRRKIKSYASHFRQLTTASDPTLQTVGSPDVPQPNHHHDHHPSEPNGGTILSFGPNMPLCDAMASVLNRPEDAASKCDLNGSKGMEERMDSASCNAEHGDEEIKEQTGANFHQTPIGGGCQGFPPQAFCFDVSSWPYPWSPPSFLTPLYPAQAYWGCAVPGAWSVPSWSISGPNSLNLGKHSRDEAVLNHSHSDRGETQTRTNKEGCLWIPKTLRIDDPEEAAKSSIWAMIGAKNDKGKSIGGGGLFKAFDRKADTPNALKHSATAPRVLYANPAALSRSLNFHERV